MRREAKKRSCGDCSLCCTLIGVQSLGKKPGKPCVYLSGNGCSRYGERPEECRKWKCGWKAGGTGLERPDLCGFIVWGEREFIIFDEAWPGAAKDAVRRIRPQEGKRIILRWAGYA